MQKEEMSMIFEILKTIALLCGPDPVCHHYYATCMDKQGFWDPPQLIECMIERGEKHEIPKKVTSR